MLVPLVATIGTPAAKLYNEGFNAYHAFRAAAGETLYTGDPYRLVNYPFISFYLVAGLKPIFGDVLMIGRALNLLGLAGILLFGALILRLLGGGALEIALTLACLLGFQIAQAAAWIGSDEPQMLAQALSLAGLACYLKPPAPSPFRLAGVSLLVMLGLFIKPIVIAIPIAIAIDLLSRDRRHFLIWCVSLAVAALLLSWMSMLIAGGNFLPEILASRFYHWNDVAHGSRKFLRALYAPILVAVIVLMMPKRHPHSRLLIAWGAVSLLAGIFGSGGDGVSANAFLEVAVFLSIIAGWAFANFRHHWVGAILPIVVALPILIRLPHTLEEIRHPQDEAAVEADFARASAFLRDRPGPALCENLLVCLRAGKPLVVDPFNAHAQVLTGRIGEDELIAWIKARRFSAIELDSELAPDPADPNRVIAHSLTLGRFTQGELKAIQDSYAPALRASGIIYLPRGT